MSLLLLIPLLLAPGAGERDNRAGVEAWNRSDGAEAVRRFDAAAAADTADADYAFNAATARARAGQDGEADFARALALARDRDGKARVFYNRGTARLRKALEAPPGQGDVSGAITDLREALKLRPSWQDASRNLDRALRLRPPPQPKQDPKSGDQPKDKDKPNPDPKDPKEPQPRRPEDGKPTDPPPSEGMDPRDAKRILDGAAAREAQQAKENNRRKNEETDGPDW